MNRVLSIEELRFERGDLLIVDAVVEEMVIVIPQTQFEPAEWGPALCRGSFDLDTDEVVPEDYEQLREFIQQRVHHWEPVDPANP